MKTSFSVLLVSLLLTGCSAYHDIDYNHFSDVETRNADGNIDVYEQGVTIKTPHQIIGYVWLGNSGGSWTCGYHDALYLARVKARELGADALIVKEVERPDGWDYCYRVGVDIVEYE